MTLNSILENKNIDITALSNSNADKNAATSKSYIDKSNNFAKVFANINKTYSDKNDSSANKSNTPMPINNNNSLSNNAPAQANSAATPKDVQQNQDLNSTEQTNTPEQDNKIQDNTEGKNTNSQSQNQNNDNSNSDNTQDTTEQDSNSTTSTMVEKNSTDKDLPLPTEVNNLVKEMNINTKTDTQNNFANANEQTQVISTIQSIARNTTTSTTQTISTTSTTSTTSATELTGSETASTTSTTSTTSNTQTTSTSSSISTSTAEVNTTFHDIIQQVTNTNTSALPQTAVDTSNLAKTVTNTNEDINQGTKAQNTSITDISAKTNVDNIVANKNNNTVQTQTYQTLSNVKTSDLQNNQAQQTQQTQQLPTETVQNANNSPVIQVNTEQIASDASQPISNNNETTTNNDNVSKKTDLTQEMIDKTNAKVASITNGNSANANANSNSNNLLNQQNAQEQTIKLAIQDTETTKNSDTTINVAAKANSNDLGTQMAFNKVLDNIQTPTQAVNQAETPKELTKTDIMSQIQAKLDTIQNENQTKVTIILKPENLGKINLELVNGKGGLTAQITADSEQVKEILNKHLDSLKDTLGNQGINVNNVNIKVSETQKQDNMFNFSEQNSQTNQNSQNNNQQANAEAKTPNEETGTLPGETIKNGQQIAETKENNTESDLAFATYNNKGQVAYKG